MLRQISLFYIVLMIVLTAFSTKVEAVTCSPPSLIPPFNTCSVSEDVIITATVPDSTVTFSGLAPAGSTVTIKDNSVVTGTTTTNPSGVFTKTVISSPGIHDFSLYLTDTSNRSTPETNFNGVSLPFHIDTPISNVLLPPTIELSKTNILNGETILIYGQGSSGSTVHIILNGSEIYSTTVTSGSDFSHSLTSSSGYLVGTNNVYTYLTRAGYTDSVQSFSKTFSVGNCRRSDLNCDGHVNLTDFSILMYWWNTPGPTGDTNLDGKVGLIDFSIMLYDWTN